MTIYEAGDVVLVPYPFSDLSGVKQRPALVVASFDELNESICMMLTSQFKGGNFEYTIENWKEAGLLVPTVARISRLFTMDYKIIRKKIGRLSNQELRNILLEFNIMCF